ncbi:MAG: HAD family hydrolase [Candidatus Aenigmarchaeota archaeon]|nr:HAD family hydrolase [Candidatus Aenigmarchaeota archaeon]
MDSKIKAIIFDWNGVVVDSFKLDHFIFLKLSKHGGIKVNTSLKFYKTLYHGDMFDRLLNLGYTEEELKDTSEYRRIYKENIHMSKTFPGIKTLLTSMKKNYILSLVTANFSDTVECWINNENFNGIFTDILTQDNAKTKEKNIDNFLKKHKLNKSQTVYVGDTIADIAVCKKVGIRIIVATWGYHNEKELKKHNPDFIARKPEDLLKILGESDG